jgi:hypothetical protein
MRNFKIDSTKYTIVETINTGKLQYGNANPESINFNSLADFYVNNDYIEIRLPWQILNFSDPSKMQIHDDYYDGNYGVKSINIKEIFVGVGDGTTESMLNKVNLNGWGNNVTYHERLKKSYYIMKELWKEDIS